MGVRENKVETYLDRQVRILGGLTRKWVSPGRDGVPDRILLIETTVKDMIYKLSQLDPNTRWSDVHLVEVKSVDGKLSQVQIREHERLKEVGANVTTVYGIDGVEEFLESIC